MTVDLISHFLIDCFRRCDKSNGRLLFRESQRKPALPAADATEHERYRPALYLLHGLAPSEARCTAEQRDFSIPRFLGAGTQVPAVKRRPTLPSKLDHPRLVSGRSPDFAPHWHRPPSRK